MPLQHDALDHVSPEPDEVQDKMRKSSYETLRAMVRHAIREVDQEVARGLRELAACMNIWRFCRVCTEQLLRNGGRHSR